MVDRYLFYFVCTLILFGIIAAYSLPTYFVYIKGLSQFHFFIRELIIGTLSILIMWGMSQLNPDVWLSRIGFSLFGFFLFVMFLMPFLPESIVPNINGAKRWIKLPFLSLSPVEFFKIGFIYFLAWSFTRKFYIPDEKFHIVKEFKILLPYFLVFGVVVLLVAFMQKDFGQVAVLGATLMLMAFFAGASFKIFAGLITSSFFGLTLLILVEPHRITRIKNWWLSIQDTILTLFPNFLSERLRIDGESLDPSYQVSQSLHGFFNGGLKGVGIGDGTVKLGFLSDIHTDFVLAGIAEEGGFVGIVLVSLIFLMVVYRIFKIANRSENHIFYLFAIGIAIMISAQFLINALGVVGLIPLKGIAVPFISYGGSSLLALSIAMGMIIMISKRTTL